MVAVTRWPWLVSIWPTPSQDWESWISLCTSRGFWVLVVFVLFCGFSFLGCVCVLYAWGCVHQCVLVRTEEISGVLFYCSLPHPQSLFIEPRACHFQISHLAANSSDPPVSVHSNAGVTDYRYTAMFFTWVLGNPNIGPPAGIAKALPTEPSP